MATIFVSHVLLGALAIALLYASYDDWRRRIIENWLTGAIAVMAPLFWWASGYALWPDIGIQIIMSVVLFLLFLGCFVLGMMGGGDVKLIAALALWFSLPVMIQLLTIMAIVGGLLTVAMMISQRMRKDEGAVEVPYGIAIAVGGLWVIAEPYLNHFAR